MNANNNNQVEGANSPQPITDETTTVVVKKSFTAKDVLSKLLAQVIPVNFLKEAFDKPDSEVSVNSKENRLREKHFLVIAIDKLMELAEKNTWGLCKNQGNTYVYNGEFWSPIDKSVLANFLGKVASKMGVGKIESKFHLFKESLVKQFYSSAHLDPPIADNETIKINLLNCTLEITPEEVDNDLRLTLRRNKFDREDFMTYQLPFDYDPDETAPKFMDFLNEVLPDSESQNVLAEYLGYLFVSPQKLKLEKALLLYGSGANGKSVFFHVVTALLGSNNVSSYTLQSLTDVNGYYRSMIGDKLVNYASEINSKLDNSFFKAMVSGEPVEARLPHKDPVMLERYAKFIFNCNELPKDIEYSHAYYRRFLIIPFDVTIPSEKQVKNLHSIIIKDELSGIFNWVLDGLKRLLEQKDFSECEAAKRALDLYRLESDGVAQFLESENYKSDVKKRITIPVLYLEYTEFCQTNGHGRLNNANFKSRLKACGILIEKKNLGYVAYLRKELYSE